jgi:hypothetical protein
LKLNLRGAAVDKLSGGHINWANGLMLDKPRALGWKLTRILSSLRFANLTLDGKVMVPISEDTSILSTDS